MRTLHREGEAPKRYDSIGMIARWQPVHLGHAAVLKALCNHARKVLIGIGSSNQHNLRTPFTLQETEAMIDRVLAGFTNYTLIPVPDLGDGPRWRKMVRDFFGPLDLFVTDNPYVAGLLTGDYRLIKPVELVPEEERIPIDGSQVRREMARGEGWRELVPVAVQDFIVSRKLDVRFRGEFGLQTLALEVIIQ